MNRKSRSLNRRSSILKIDVNRDDDTGVIVGRNRSSRRVSFAEIYQVKEFPRDSPRVYRSSQSDDDSDGKDGSDSSAQSKSHGITGLDKLLTGAIQTPYQNVAEYAIPEISSDSFNIFDINNTVLDAVDIETTLADGNIDTIIPQMNFQSEPSMELKFDAQSLLQSLRGKPSDRLKTMQIYSPNRDKIMQEHSSPRDRPLQLDINFSGQDKENMNPIEAFHDGGDDVQTVEAGVDSRSLLQRLFGGPVKPDEDVTEAEEMEETACIGHIVGDMKKIYVIEPTTTITQGLSNDVTKYFDSEDVTVDIEETKCIGGIINEALNVDQQVGANKENSVHFSNQKDNKVETKLVGPEGILKTCGVNKTIQVGLRMQQGYDREMSYEDKVIVASDHSTQQSLAEQSLYLTTAMEETKPVGGILRNTMEETKATEEILNKTNSKLIDMSTTDKEFHNKSMNCTVAMEETKPLGGILDKTDSKMIDMSTTNKEFHSKSMNCTVAMEETKPIGGILDKTNSKMIDMSTTNKEFHNKSMNFTTAMEETKPIGGILDKTNSKMIDMSTTNKEFHSKSMNCTVAMEETKPIGGMLEKTNSKMIDMSTTNKEFHNKSMNCTVAMGETKPIGGILDKTNSKMIDMSTTNKEFHNKSMNCTVAMEETKPIGGILDKTNSKMIDMPTTNKEFHNKSMNCTVAMEETKPIGGILDKTNSKMIDMPTTNKEFHNKSMNCTVAMGETKPIGGILDKTNSKMIDMPTTNTQFHSKSMNFTIAMEETKPIGGILDKANSKMIDMSTTNKDFHSKSMNFTVAMEETKPIGGILDKTNSKMIDMPTTDNEFHSKSINFTVAMEETKPIGGILDKTNSKMIDMSTTNKEFHSKSMNCTVAMEETKPIGGILDKTNSKMIDMPTTNTQFHSKSMNCTVAMEETKPIGGILDKTNSKMIDMSTTNKEFHSKSMNFTIAMEETKPIGGILDKTNSKMIEMPTTDKVFHNKSMNCTVAMEETESIGRIIDKPIGNKTFSEYKLSNYSMNKTVNKTLPIEEIEAVGCILNKTSDQTMYFDDIKTDWVSNDIKSEGKGKAADGTIVNGHKVTAAVEETKCVGAGILSNDIEIMKLKLKNMQNHGKDDTFNKTTIETVHMEETRCVTAVVDTGINKMNTVENITRDQNLTKPNWNTLQPSCIEEVRRVTLLENDIAKSSKIEVGTENSAQVNELVTKSGDISADEKMTFKISNKRNIDVFRGEAQEKNEEKTQDYKQSTSNLAKLKEMLILSKRKTASQLRASEIKTPSKWSPLFQGTSISASKALCSGKLDLGVTRSPVHKRQRLSEGVMGVEMDLDFGGNEKTDPTAALLAGFEDDGLAIESMDQSIMDHSDWQGIDGETMPDTMHLDLCVSSSSNETNSDKSSTVRNHRASTTEHTSPASIMKYKDPTSPSIHNDLSSTAMRESNKSLSSGSDGHTTAANLSIFSNKSFALSSFIIPDGPLSLKSFFDLTFTLSAKVQCRRCSAVFAPTIDLEDVTDVLHAELTLKPLVDAKKKMQEKFTEQIETTEDSMEWLEKMLEETQPEIFQECAGASSEELQQITIQLRSLLRACQKKVEIAWKEGTKQMFAEALHNIQEVGVKRAEEMLEKAQLDNKSVDDLFTSLDDALESLDRDEQMLEDLQNKQAALKRDTEQLATSLQERTLEQNVLKVELQSQAQRDCIKEETSLMKSQIVAHLLCCEWNLEDLQDDYAVFSFLDDKLELCVKSVPGVEHKQISSITLRRLAAAADCRYLENRIAVSFVQRGIDTDNLQMKYTNFSSLSKLLHEVSSCVNEVKRFCREVEEVNVQHVLTFTDDRIYVELWDRETMDFIKVSFRFDPREPLTNPVTTNVWVRIGTLKACNIEENFRKVAPGPKYLSRLIGTVDFKQLQQSRV